MALPTSSMCAYPQLAAFTSPRNNTQYLSFEGHATGPWGRRLARSPPHDYQTNSFRIRSLNHRKQNSFVFKSSRKKLVGGAPLLFAPKHPAPVNAYGNETRKSQWSNMSVIRGVPHCRHAYNRSFGSGLRRPDHFKPLVPCFASANHGRFNGMSTLTIPGIQSGNGRRLGDLGT